MRYNFRGIHVFSYHNEFCYGSLNSFRGFVCSFPNCACL